MGILNLKSEKHHRDRIKKALRRRGLELDTQEEWEIHGPHQDMNYQVYVGGAYINPTSGAKCICPDEKMRYVNCKAHRREFWVAIYPKAVYKIEEPSNWGQDAIPENRITIHI